MRPFFPVLILSLTITFSCHAAGDKPAKQDKCPVCGMFVSHYPDWFASISYKGGETAYFDGPKDMFTYYLNLPKYAKGKNRGDIVSIRVKEYYGLKSVDAEKVLFVAGSDVYGPMGKELIPLLSAKDAAGFIKDHKGDKPLRFNEVTPAVLKRLE